MADQVKCQGFVWCDESASIPDGYVPTNGQIVPVVIRVQVPGPVPTWRYASTVGDEVARFGDDPLVYWNWLGTALEDCP